MWSRMACWEVVWDLKVNCWCVLNRADSAVNSFNTTSLRGCRLRSVGGVRSAYKSAS